MGNCELIMKSRCLLIIGLICMVVYYSEAKCCKTCKKGKPCGDTCISQDAECHRPHGCACALSCCKHCVNGKPCGNSCIEKTDTCQQDHGCACYGGPKTDL